MPCTPCSILFVLGGIFFYYEIDYGSLSLPFLHNIQCLTKPLTLQVRQKWAQFNFKKVKEGGSVYLCDKDCVLIYLSSRFRCDITLAMAGLSEDVKHFCWSQHLFVLLQKEIVLLHEKPSDKVWRRSCNWSSSLWIVQMKYTSHTFLGNCYLGNYFPFR